MPFEFVCTLGNNAPMFIESIKKYDGYLLHNRFAFTFFRDKVSPLGNIIAFRGPMEVLADSMIDQEDVLNEAFIWSDDAIHFMWEMPILDDNVFGAVAYQRLLNTTIANILSGPTFLNRSVWMKGDDIMVGDGKASVSIVHVKNGAALGHTGINIKAGSKAPSFAFSTELSDQRVTQFVHQVLEAFDALNKDIFIATSKVLA